MRRKIIKGDGTNNGNEMISNQCGCVDDVKCTTSSERSVQRNHGEQSQQRVDRYLLYRTISGSQICWLGMYRTSTPPYLAGSQRNLSSYHSYSAMHAIFPSALISISVRSRKSLSTRSSFEGEVERRSFFSSFFTAKKQMVLLPA